MELIQDSDYVLYNAMAEKVISGLSKPLKMLTEKCEVLAAKYAKMKAKFFECGTYDEIGESSNQLRLVENELIKLLSIQDRLVKIVHRNKKRQELFKSRFETVGIYNFEVDKKDFFAAISKEEKNVSEKTLNLNPFRNEDVNYVFFEGKVLAFKNGVLDLSLEENEKVLDESDASFFHELVTTFPEAVATIPDKFYLSSRIKTCILKESVLFAAAKLKTQTIAESNKELGGLLVNAGEITTIAKFADELKNYFNVLAKQCLKENSPELATDIDDTLKCNESSEFLPRSKRVAVLANGLAADAPKTEAEESEEVRKEQEKEAQEKITREDLLSLLLADEEEDLELQETIEETSKIAEEERKLNDEMQDDLDLEELERELGLALKKNDTVDN